MMEFREPDRDSNQADRDEEARVTELLRSAGRPEKVPAADLEALEGTVRAEWRALYGNTSRTFGSRSRWWLTPPALAAAALLAMAVALGLWALRRTPTEPSVATPLLQIAALSGSPGANRIGDSGESIPLVLGESVPIGTELRTSGAPGKSRLSLRTADGVSIRLDSGSRLTFLSPEKIELHRGAVYIDSPGDGTDMTVHTPFGVAQEIGTQFEVRLITTEDESESAVRVRVRKGAVSLDSQGERRTVERGHEVVATEGGKWSEGILASYDPSWQWVIDAGPSFSTEGRSVAELLEWVGREAGWEVRYQNDEVAATAQRVVYSGAFESLRPEDAIEIALPGALLEGEVREGILEVRRSGEQ